MTEAWYAVASMLFGYFSAAVALLVVLFAIRKGVSDAALVRRLRKNLPGALYAGTLRVLSSGRGRLEPSSEIPVPYEGTLGSAHSCDVCIPYRKVHFRSAFFWMERGALHMAALHRDGFAVDDVPVLPGDEAIMENGAILCVGDLRMLLCLGSAAPRERDIGPYVTTARRSRAQQGRGEGVGRPGKGEIYREKRLRKKQRGE